MSEQRESARNFKGKLWEYARSIFRARSAEAEPVESQPPADQITEPCCGPGVHIAYRGKIDDRMYVAYNRTWQEVRFFQPNGLRVFCAQCRRRVL